MIGSCLGFSIRSSLGAAYSAICERRIPWGDAAQVQRYQLHLGCRQSRFFQWALDFFTGGLQHFPDSPVRSAWVVPLGFAVSVPALALSGGFAWADNMAW
jgi:hypothetical protein